MEMRRFDVWVGRLAAVAGLVYVVLCTLWPLNASAMSAIDLRVCAMALAATPTSAKVDRRCTSDARSASTPSLLAADAPAEDPAPSIVVLAAVATFVLLRRWHDPHASLAVYGDPRLC